MLFAATTAAHKSNNSYIIVIYLVIFGAFYFFYIRPRSRKQKATRQQARQVEVGERARTIGGMIGTVVKRTEVAVTLRTASGHEIDFIPSAIAGRHDPVPASSDDEVTADEVDNDQAKADHHNENEDPSPEGDEK